MNKNCFFLFLISLESLIKYVNNTENIQQSTLSFLIPLESAPSISGAITLELSEPTKRNGDHCYAECSYNNGNLECKITKVHCDSINYNSKKVTVLSILTSNYEFVNKGSLTSYISFKTTSIEMTCSNFKLSFIFYYEGLNNHPYTKTDFSIPIYYKDKKGEAKCILPEKTSYIPCIIDADNILYQKGYSIVFESSKPIIINENLNLSLTIEKYKLEDDCGKDTSSSNYIDKLNLVKVINIILLIFL